MAKKKITQISVSREDNAQAQHILEQYHQIASALHTSIDRKQAEAALTEINTLSEGTQLALLKALSKEHHTDAADVLAAINELSPVKSVRKEARRSLIRLEGARIYPHWQPPVEQPALSVVSSSDIPRRFWKAMVTDSFEAGEVELILCWEQGNDYKEVRVLGFLLDFWQDGVKDFFTRVESKRSFENFAVRMAETYGMKMKSCSLAEGRHWILDALQVNKKLGTVPHKDYRFNLSLVNKLVLEAPDLDEESEESLELQDLTPQDVVVNFVEAWVSGDYKLAYALLSSDSAIREGLSKEEWVARRKTWSDKASPDDLKPDFIQEREPQKPRLWLPFGGGHATTHKEIEAAWSIELDETALSDILPELPTAAAISEETGRHWFWASYTLVQEENAWRIQSVADEGTRAQSLSIEELQKKIKEIDKYLNEFAQKHKPVEVRDPTDPDVQHYLAEILQHALQSTYYLDALIKKLPLDRSLYEDAVVRTSTIGQFERCMVYLEPLARRFAERRGKNLRQLASVQRQLSMQYFEKGDDDRGERFQELAKETLDESLTVEEDVGAHISLAELFIGQESFDEAEEHLLSAKALATNAADEGHIEMHLGEIATEREHYEEALSHYQRAAELTPNYVDTWTDLAEAHRNLNNFEEAETSYKRAIELEPDNPDLYLDLSKMHAANNQPEKALMVMEDALSANPDSAVLNVYLATMYLEREDYRQAELFLDKAERLDPELEVLPMFRQMLQTLKFQPELTTPKSRPTFNISKRNRPKKRR